MKISLLLLVLVAGSIAANIDDTNARKGARELAGLDEELEDFLIKDGDDDFDDFDEEEEDADQSSLVKSVTFLQGRAGVCAGKAKGSCNKQGGECVTAPFADNCKAIHGDAGKLKKQACKSKDCQCCVPPVPEDNLLPTITIRDEKLSLSCGWFCNIEVTYTLVLARGYGNEDEFIYIQKGKFDEGYTLDNLINVCDLQYGTYEMTNGRKGVFMVYHDKSLNPYQKRFDLHEDGITQDILNTVGESIDSETFPGSSTSSSFWDFSWLTGNYLKNVDC